MVESEGVHEEGVESEGVHEIVESEGVHEEGVESEGGTRREWRVKECMRRGGEWRGGEWRGGE